MIFFNYLVPMHVPRLAQRSRFSHLFVNVGHFLFWSGDYLFARVNERWIIFLPRIKVAIYRLEAFLARSQRLFLLQKLCFNFQTRVSIRDGHESLIIW